MRRHQRPQFSLQWFTPLVTCSIHPVFCYPRPLASILLEVKRPTARSRLLPARYRRASWLQGGLSWLTLMFLYNIGAITTGLRKSAWQQTKMSGLQQGLSPRRVIIGETELKHQISCQVFPTFPSSPSSPRSLVWDPLPVARLSAWNTDVIIIVWGGGCWRASGSVCARARLGEHNRSHRGRKPAGFPRSPSRSPTRHTPSAFSRHLKAKRQDSSL